MLDIPSGRVTDLDREAALERLEEAIQKLDMAELQETLRATVEGYVPASTAHPVSAKDEWQPASRTLH